MLNNQSRPIKSLIHYHPYLCFLNILDNETITCSKDINEVTCPYCSYYYFHPNARELEFQYMSQQYDRNPNQ